MKKILVIVVASLMFSSCLRMDDFLYNESKIDQYLLDNYTGEVDFKLGAEYAIPDSLFRMFTLNSQSVEETSPTKIYAMYLGDVSKISTDTVILYCHGNKDHMDFYWQRAKLIANIGGNCHYGVMTFDYRGFGMSEGKPTEDGLYADSDAALKWLKDNGLTSDRLIIYGFSLGSAPATKLSANQYTLKPSKLILEAPFASSAVMVQDGSAMSMPASLYTNLKIDNAEQIKSVTQPFLWIHGVEDGFLSMKTHGEVIYKNYKGFYSEAHRIEGADHGTVPQTVGFQNYLEIMDKFIKK
ncbi:MAG: alpha/beta hydrolase [Bacteroidota bacterium]